MPATAATTAAVSALVAASEALMAAPVISGIAPNTGLPDTATAVTITGTGFTGATEVAFGETPATNLVVVSDTEITAETPLIDELTTVNVTVFTPEGDDTLFGGFTFEEAGTPPGGDGTEAFFPAFDPIIPPPLIGQGGGPPPTFPPPTPPPIGTIPPGVLVGPAIAAAAVPPSLAGVVQPQFGSGSATTPAVGPVPVSTTTFPVPTIVFSNIFTGHSPPVTPPSTASTLNIVLDGWGPHVPPGAPTAPGSDGRLPRMLEMLAAAAEMGGLHGGEITGERRRARRH